MVVVRLFLMSKTRHWLSKGSMTFLKQYDPRNLPDGKITTITANQGQINTALAAALAAVPQLKAQIVPSRFGLLAAITGETPLPDNPFGKFINISMMVNPRRLVWRSDILGSVRSRFRLPSSGQCLSLSWIRLRSLDAEKAFLEMIRSVQVTGNRYVSSAGPRTSYWTI